MAHEVETMFSAREVPWHRLGNIADDVLTASEALASAGLDWRVNQIPVQLADGSRIVIPDTFANVRDSDGSILGIVNKMYRVLQNEEAFAFADSLASLEGLKYETAGSLFGGRQVFLCADLGQIEVGPGEAQDKVAKNYLVLSNGHDGKRAIRAVVTPIRVVCNNTLQYALRSAQRAWAIRHTVNAEERLKEARKALDLVHQYHAQLDQFAHEAYAQKISKAQAQKFIESLYPVEEDASDRKKDNAQAWIDDLVARYTQAPDTQNFRGTKWGMLLALADHRDHKPEQRLGSGEGVMRKVINGDAWMDEAVSKLMVAA